MFSVVFLSCGDSIGGNKVSCHCNVFSDFCNDTPGRCIRTNCQSSSIGCGWFLSATCNGRCGGM